jgi:hypothetical protein
LHLNNHLFVLTKKTINMRPVLVAERSKLLEVLLWRELINARRPLLGMIGHGTVPRLVKSVENDAERQSTG